MQKPYVIIHTHTSLDGRIHVVGSPKFETTSQQYQELAFHPATVSRSSTRMPRRCRQVTSSPPLGLFTAAEPLSAVEARSFTLIEARPLHDSTVLLRYRVDNR